MQAIHSVESIRCIERQLFATMPSFALMQMAGEAVAERAQKMVRQGARIVVVAGRGNNGGDGYIAATALQKSGYRVQVVAVGGVDNLPPDALRAARAWGEARTVLPASAPLPPADLYIDALLGIGVNKPLTAEYQKWVERINDASIPVLAVDVPSGLCADTAWVDPCAVQATVTVTFFAAKAGLVTGHGVDYAGRVEVCPLVDVLPQTSNGQLLDELPNIDFLRRQHNSHKRHYGAVYLLGGATGMVGALVLSARAAVGMGAGKVTAVSLQQQLTVDFLHPEIMWATATTADWSGADVIAVGMGLGQSPAAQNALTTLLKEVDKPMLIDADAINLIAQSDKGLQLLRQRQSPIVLTPHPAEAGRLLGCPTKQINRNRVHSAIECAEKTGAIVVLKGAGSVIATPSGQYYICTAGNAGLARGGSGDVLSGMVATLLGQAPSAEAAATAGVYLHAAAADVLRDELGEIGLDINLIARRAALLAGKYNQGNS